MHDDEFELDFGEDELELAPPTAAPSADDAAPLPPAADAALPARDADKAQVQEGTTPVAASTTKLPVSSSSASALDSSTRLEAPAAPAAAPASSSSGAPGSWGRSLPRQNSRQEDGRREASRRERADDRFAPRPSTSRAPPTTSQPSSSSSTPVLPPSSTVPSSSSTPAVASASATAPGPAPKPRDETVDSNGRPLPAGWVSRVSKSTNTLYYRNVKMNTTCWDIPQKPAEEPEVVIVEQPQQQTASVQKAEEREATEQEQEQPKRQPAVHPDRLRLLGVDVSSGELCFDSASIVQQLIRPLAAPSTTTDDLGELSVSPRRQRSLGCERPLDFATHSSLLLLRSSRTAGPSTAPAVASAPSQPKGPRRLSIEQGELSDLLRNKRGRFEEARAGQPRIGGRRKAGEAAVALARREALARRGTRRAHGDGRSGRWNIRRRASLQSLASS